MTEPRQTTIEEAITPCDPHITPEEVPRLSRQCSLVLERLRQGPATNDELATISRKYTSRISDLRSAGHDVEAFDRNHKTGVCWYRLKANP